MSMSLPTTSSTNRTSETSSGTHATASTTLNNLVNNNNGNNGSVATKRKVNFITVEEKYKALRALERKETTINEICARLDVGKSTVFGWHYQREKIIDDYETKQFSSKRMKVRGSKNKEIEELLQEYINTTRLTNGGAAALSGPNLLAKAEYFAKLLGDYEFKANNSWLDRFRKRNHISMKLFKNDEDPSIGGGQYSFSEKHMDVHSGEHQQEENGTDAGHSSNSNQINGNNNNNNFEQAADHVTGEGEENYDFDENFEVENFVDDDSDITTASVPSKVEVRNYISKMRLYYQNKIEECNKFLNQLDEMESDL